MFNSITWGQYFSTILLLLIIYYTLIGFRFYKWEILSIVGIRKVDDDSLNTTAALSNLKEFTSSENHENYLPKPNAEIDISLLVQSFNDEVTAFVQGADEGEITKENIINSLQAICSKFPAIKNAERRKDLEVAVLKQINLKYPTLLQPNDFRNLWN
ncbi:MAG: hypothetical protein ABIN01_08800 [Ferruginibacter sp.]